VADDGTRIIVLRGAIRGKAEEVFRTELLGAIDEGAKEIILDLSETETVVAAVHELVAAASSTLADRDGVLLTWSEKHASGGATYLIAEVRDRGLGELVQPENRAIEK
jgi:anti-anti-sigma regulatory factor